MSRSRLRAWPAALLGALILVAGLSRPAAAHPAPSVIHDYLVQIGPGTAQVDLRLAVSPQLVPQVYRKIDTNGDGVTQTAERQAWLDAYLAHMAFTVDDQPAQMHLVGASTVDQQNIVVSMQRPITVTMQVTFALPADKPGAAPTDHHFVLADGTNYVGYDEYYSSWEDLPGAITLAHDLTQPANPATFEAVFERDATTAPAAAAAPTPAPSGTGFLSGITDTFGSARDSFVNQLDTFVGSPQHDLSFGLLLFLLAVGLGALHALTPGHGKAVVAAYLVGSRGRVRDAVALGGIVTLTHTLSVVLLGVVLLVVTSFAVPRWLQPALELGSGLLIVGLGIYLLLDRLRGYRRTAPAPAPAAVPAGNPAVALAGAGAAFVPLPAAPAYPEHAHHHAEAPVHAHSHAEAEPHTHTPEQAHEHPHPHDHNHPHTHDMPDHPHEHDHASGHDHTHGPGGHSHVPPPGASARDLLALGVSGGLVPCPDALAILLLTIPVGQIGFGLLLVSSFSIGLAAVLIAIGILMVKAHGLLERLLPGGPGRNPRWIRALPVASAGVVIVLGVVLALSAVLGQKWA